MSPPFVSFTRQAPPTEQPPQQLQEERNNSSNTQIESGSAPSATAHDLVAIATMYDMAVKARARLPTESKQDHGRRLFEMSVAVKTKKARPPPREKPGCMTALEYIKQPKRRRKSKLDGEENMPLRRSKRIEVSNLGSQLPQTSQETQDSQLSELSGLFRLRRATSNEDLTSIRENNSSRVRTKDVQKTAERKFQKYIISAEYGKFRPPKIEKVTEKIVAVREVPDSEAPTYCTCNDNLRDYVEKMVQCGNKICPWEWFHYSCVGLTRTPRGHWYCPTCRADEVGKTEKSIEECTQILQDYNELHEDD